MLALTILYMPLFGGYNFRQKLLQTDLNSGALQGINKFYKINFFNIL